MPLTEVNAEIGLPWGIGRFGGRWRPDDSERAAAWEMLVELSTRVTLTELPSGEGFLRESLSSLYSLFDITRGILRRHGPALARPVVSGSAVSLGMLSVGVLNGGIRPFLTYWHPTLSDHEHQRPQNLSELEWERAWERGDEFRAELNEVRAVLRDFAGIIAEACGGEALLVGATFAVPRPPGSTRG